MSEDFGAREFKKGAYDHCDGFAKSLFKKFIEKHGHIVTNDEEDYDHDIITEKDGVEFYFELETKGGYSFTTKETYRFETVSFLGRKERLHKKQPFYYIIICRETEYAVCAHSSDIFKEEFKEDLNINTKYRKGKDQMFRVPLKYCHFFNLNFYD